MVHQIVDPLTFIQATPSPMTSAVPCSSVDHPVRSLGIPASNQLGTPSAAALVCHSQHSCTRHLPTLAVRRTALLSPQAGRDLDLPVYFGDAGSPGVLHSVGAHRAACAVITLDTPGANYRTVWAINKHFPGVKSYVRAHDVDHGINLEKAGATAVVPETLEPSLQVAPLTPLWSRCGAAMPLQPLWAGCFGMRLNHASLHKTHMHARTHVAVTQWCRVVSCGVQLAAAVLMQLQLPPDDVNDAIQNFRLKHIAELQELCRNTGSSLGYGYAAKEIVKDYPADSSVDSDEEIYLRARGGGPLTVADAVP